MPSAFAVPQGVYGAGVLQHGALDLTAGRLTKNFWVALYKAHEELDKNPALEVTYVYVIDRPPTAFPIYYPSFSRKWWIFAWEREILVPYGIPGSRIFGAFAVPKDRPYEYFFVPNQYYGGPY